MPGVRRQPLVLLWLLSACTGAAETPDPRPVPVRRVLFVGNSLTYVNDLPSVVTAVAASAGIRLETGTSAGPNLALIDHLDGQTDALARLATQHWDWVVLQQGPTTIGLCRDSLLLWAREFGARIRARGGKPALLMTWPAKSSPEHFDDVRLSFQSAAAAADGIFLPAGEAWRLALAGAAGAPLYARDGFHPAPAGTYLAALVVVERLTGRDPRTFPVTGVVNGVPARLSPATVRLLQESAHAANERWPAGRPGPLAALGNTSHASPPGGRC